MKPTDTYLPDLPDLPSTPRNVEAEQLENMQAAIGLTLWAWLQEKEEENARANRV